MALAWCFDDEAIPFTEAVLDLMVRGVTARVPAIWPLEVSNAILSAERKKRTNTAQSTAFLRRIREFSISVEHSPTALAFDQILSLARQQSLTVYDASYLELAVRESLPLATLDANLRRAAGVVGVNLLEK